MKILRKADKTITKYLSMQQLEEGCNYVLSNCVIKDGNIYYNALTNEGIYVEDYEKDRISLIRRWYLIPDNLDINSVAHTIRQKVLYSRTGPGSSLKTNYVIFTTTACNAACSYCFEKGFKPVTMTAKTAEDVSKYILQTKATDKVNIRWFGGEPLVNKEAINIISNRLTDNNVKIFGELSTNGDLLPLCSNEEILSWRLRKIQFTLDDTYGEYDRIKGLPNGAYEKLKSTIERLNVLLPTVNIAIRIHLDPIKGSDSCYKVIDDLKDYKNLHIYPRILYQEATIDDYKELLKIEDYIMSIGKHDMYVRMFAYGPHCMGDSTKVVGITPTGELTPCEHYAYGEHIYGSIYTREKNLDILKNWSVREKYVTPTCKDCPLYPSCRKLVMCPAEGKCSEGYQYYQIETIKRALRKKVEEINGDKGH